MREAAMHVPVQAPHIQCSCPAHLRLTARGRDRSSRSAARGNCI